jgi:RNA polymerase-binding transcription factor DksA
MPDAAQPLARLERLDAIATRLDGVERALAALDAGSYGRCRSCGSDLSDGVLARDPLADACDGEECLGAGPATH